MNFGLGAVRSEMVKARSEHTVINAEDDYGDDLGPKSHFKNMRRLMCRAF